MERETRNASGHTVKTPQGLIAYHADRMLTAIEMARLSDFAEVLAYEHAVAAAHAAARS